VEHITRLAGSLHNIIPDSKSANVDAHKLRAINNSASYKTEPQ